MNNSQTNQKFNWTPLIVIVILLVLSIIMMALPDFALDVMVIVPAVGFLVYGAVSIVYYAVSRTSANLSKSYLVWPIIALVIGILLLSFLKQVEYIIPIFIGIWLVVTAFFSFNTVKKMVPGGGSKFIMIMGFLQLAFGILFIVVGFGGWIHTMVVVLGAFLFVYSLISIITFIVQANVNKKYN